MNNHIAALNGVVTLSCSLSFSHLCVYVSPTLGCQHVPSLPYSGFAPESASGDIPYVFLLDTIFRIVVFARLECSSKLYAGSFVNGKEAWL